MYITKIFVVFSQSVGMSGGAPNLGGLLDHTGCVVCEP